MSSYNNINLNTKTPKGAIALAAVSKSNTPRRDDVVGNVYISSFLDISLQKCSVNPYNPITASSIEEMKFIFLDQILYL